MKTNYYALLFLSVASVLLWAQCDAPTFENIDHPFEVSLNDTVEIPITVVRGAFPMLNDSLLTPELEKVIKLYQEDIVPLMSSREGAFYLWLGIQLPENWSTTNNFDYVAYDSLPAMNIDSGTFVYSQEHIDLLNTEWNYTLDSGNKWVAWKSADPIEFDYGKMWTNPQIITDDNSGYFRLSYLLGYDTLSPCAQTINNITIASPNLDTAWVTNTNDSGEGTLRKATIDVRSGGHLLFDIDKSDTIKLINTLTIYKPFRINNNQSDSLINIKGPDSSGILVIDHRMFNQYNSNYYVTTLNKLNLFGAGVEAVNVIENRDFYIYNSRIHDNQGSGIRLTCGYEDNSYSANINNCDIYNNNGNYGGGIFSNNYRVDVSGSRIFNNNALANGGGIYIENCSYNSSIYYSNIYNNTSQYGGGIHTSNTVANIDQVYIQHNTASLFGGGIYAQDNSGFYIRNTTIARNNAMLRGGGGYFESDTDIDIGDSGNSRCNIYLNQSIEGHDLFSWKTLNVYVDTFTVMVPTKFHASPFENFNFDILHGYVDQTTEDLFVSPGGDNQNSGLTEDEPLKNFYYAFVKTMADSTNQQTVHLLDGTYSPSATGEIFPLFLPDFIELVGVSDSLVTIDAEKMGNVINIHDNTANLIQGLTITGGKTNYEGGGIYIYESDPIIQDVTISNNQAEQGGGGGIYIYESDPIIQNVTVSNNHAYEGGGIYSEESNPLLQDLTINNNNARRSGGGLYCYYSNPSLSNVKLTGNTSIDGSGMYISYSYPVEINNLIISKNTAINNGGGIYFDRTSNLRMKSTTISNNFARYGGGIYFGQNAYGQFFDNINRCNIYYNKAIHGNDVYTNMPSTNIIVDTFTVLHPGDYYAKPQYSFDFDIWNAKIEQQDADLYVSPEGDNNNTGLTPEEPIKNIDVAFGRIWADYQQEHVVYLMEGTYGPYLSDDLFPLNIPSFVGIEGMEKDKVVLDGRIRSTVINLWKSYHASVSNLTIINGRSNEGAGINIYSCDPLIQDVILTDNRSEESGGAIYCSNSKARIINSEIVNNRSHEGGGIFLNSSNVKLKNVKLQNNSATRGGGLYCGSSQPMLINLLITDNHVGSEGGAMYLDNQSHPKLINVTTANNFAGEYGGGIYLGYSCNPMLYNTIMWNDSPNEVNMSNMENNYSSLSVYYSNIQGGEEGIITGENGVVYWEEGSIDQDPEFIEFSNDDIEYTLTAFSPCIDAGRPDTTGLYLPEYDLADNYRLWDGDNDGEAIIDMGAFEFASHPVGFVAENDQNDVSFQCYPNPATTSTQIEFELKEAGMVQINVFNLLGEKVDVVSNTVLPKGKNSVRLNTSELSNGFYFIQLQTTNTTQSQKILKQ